MAIPFLALTFFWMVIGDLITYHQKAIFDFDLFNHQPFTKPGKNDTGILLYKTKGDKTVSVDKYKHTLHSVVADDYSTLLGDFAKNITVRFNYRDMFQQRYHQSVSLRGPPQS
jgi:hypothetical protein